MKVIQIKNLCKNFDEHVLFKNFNLIINDGDFLCISGDSGTGKTTLLNMIGQLEPYQEGEILFEGKPIETKKDKLDLFRKKLGFIFQNFVLVESKTVEENLKLIRKEDRTDVSIDSALKMVGLDDKKNSKVYTLSGGEQQRVAMARLYLKECKYILADEPTGSLDRKNAEKIFEILKQLNDIGKTIIIVTHDEYLKSKVEKRVNLNEM
ncbi:ABC transporter ATP-binding protein [Anaerococcus lactolyticus]|uniref:Putative bacteriocin export ABC transporter, lactococcin 972 group n=1 Tax=Anaerococcus lactolyticus ATCC 51172 TaxID=525254 RepID=C2BH76_9FIRM|nr:ABC transporter ATP-binding protein [Anaerococcus lactolyticus]EEI85719.1 putative bacteriocin export ABC transporter, lactococcin 972 group [Anaerococcus lactolyticus ATCC 51172]